MMQGKILVLDDEENYAEMLQGLLRQHRFSVDMATKPELALEALEECPYALVISDYKMPIMDGAVFLKKARDIYPDLPFILVSGLMNTPELVKVANMGVTLVLEKPLDTHYFLEQVRRFVSPMPEGQTAEEPDVRDRPASAEVEATSQKSTYPDDLKYMAGRSPATQRLLQSAWDMLQRGAPISFTGPEGSEWDLLLKELAHWKGEGGCPNPFFSASQLRKESVQAILGALPGQTEQSTVVAVGDVSSASPEDQAWLAGFLKQTAQSASGEKGLTFVLWVDRPDQLTPDLGLEVRSAMVKFPPLADRLEDLAVYATRALGRFFSERTDSEPPRFTPEAAHLLLQFPWPGNYAQLVKAMRACARGVEDSAVPAGLLRAAIADLAPRTPLPPEATNLEEALIARQQQILRAAASRQQTPERKILSRLGFDVSELPPELGIESLDLLYPELLESTEK